MKRFLVAFSLCFFVSSLSFAQIDLQTIAVVKLTKSEPITVKQVKNEAEQYVKAALIQETGRQPSADELNKALQGLSLDDKRQVLNLLINEKLTLQAAERDRVSISENEVNQQINALRSQLARNIGKQPTDAEFSLAIRNQMGMELPVYRDMVRRQLLMQKYLVEKKQNVLNGFKNPTDEDILTEYKLRETQLVRPRTVRFSMIEIPYGSDKAKARELANRLMREINGSPAKFDEAVVKGQTPSSGYRAGDGGYLPMIPQAQAAAGKEFIDTAFSLKQGEVSKLIENTRAYQIFKITESYEKKDLELDDLYQLGGIRTAEGQIVNWTVKDYLYNGLLQQRQAEALQKATQELVVELRRGNPFTIDEKLLNW
ncbi:MAG: SurA N-terminal domain-containing protein [Treponema sp.]|jgi:parvulin-like peptidyl-prolyl isomerase|nr:SurA N-terminal domain-containing protein [Treponema sp.]